MRGRGVGTTYRSIIYSLRFASVGDRHKMPVRAGDFGVMKRFIVFAALIASPAFAAGPAPQSAAQAFDAHITSGGVSTEAGPFADVVGQGGSAYNEIANGSPENEVVPLLPRNPTPSLYLDLGAVKANASNTGIQLDSESWGGSAAVDRVNAAINLKPLPPGAPHPQPFLERLPPAYGESHGGAEPGVPVNSRRTRRAAAKLNRGGLDISGSALGFSAVHFSGSPAANTVVYDTPTVTITLNRRIESGLISCSPAPGGCTFTPYTIETDAVDIDLHKAPWDGNKYSGHIVIGRATAGQ